MVPSGSMESQRSHTVVAPMVTGYSQDGQPSSSSSRYASSTCPVSVRAWVMNGVPAKPVDTR